MTDKVLIDRELLTELRDAASECLDREDRQRRQMIYSRLVSDSDAILSQPQPAEPAAVEVVADKYSAATAYEIANGEPSPTKGMTLGERIAHVGGRTNRDGYQEFGSVMAVHALISHVLRDLPVVQPPATDIKGSRKALGTMNAKLRAKVGRLERELASHNAEVERLRGELAVSRQWELLLKMPEWAAVQVLKKTIGEKESDIDTLRTQLDQANARLAHKTEHHCEVNRAADGSCFQCGSIDAHLSNQAKP